MKIFGPRLKSRGSLQLSINAIVILILAITILGLGLGFIKKQFGSLGEQFTSVSEEIKGEIVEKIRQSGDLLVFNKQEINVQKGKPEKFFMGIKNTGSDVTCFLTNIECIQSLVAGPCEEGQASGVRLPVGGRDLITYDRIDGGWFTLFDQIDIEPGSVGVIPVTLQIPGDVSPDTYLVQLSVYEGDLDCGNVGQFGGTTVPPEPHATRQFFINVR